MNREKLQNAYDICVKKFEAHMKKYDKVMEYDACKTGDYYSESKTCELYCLWNWMSSFITGLAPLYYKSEKDENLLKWAERFKDEYRTKVFEYPIEAMHDLGFLYSPYCVEMYRQSGDKIYRDCAVKAADELVKRFDVNGRHINAWHRMDEERDESRAIIDSMMNTSLLFWAWKETKHTIYKDIATIHADTTLKYFIRDDGSVAHSFSFDRKTGEMLVEMNNCGFGNGSYWARGTAWAVYGYANAYRYTGYERYYTASKKIAEKYMETIDGYIPVWDLKLPKDLPAYKCAGSDPDKNFVWDESDPKNCKYNVDTSAAMILADGLFELTKLKPDDKLTEFMIKSVETVCDEYMNYDVNIPGILQGQNGNMSFATYGDYFTAEILQRILYDYDTCW